MFGRTYPARGRQAERRYYQCHGKDCIMTARPAACPTRNVKAGEIETAVWDHVSGLLSDPERLVAQFEHLAATAEAGTIRDRAADQQLRARLDRLTRADKRLLDASEADAISLAELSERRHHLAGQRRDLERQQQERDRLRQQHAQAEAVRTSLAAFCSRVGARLDEATLSDKQAILQLVIERIIVGEGSLEIRHVIPLSASQPGSDGPNVPNAQLRSDGLHAAALPGRAEDLANGAFQALVRVRDHQLRAAQATTRQAAQKLDPERFGLAVADGHAQHLAPAVGVDADCDDDRNRDDLVVPPNLHVGGVPARRRASPSYSRP